MLVFGLSGFSEPLACVLALPLSIKHVAIDGKTLRGSGSAKLGPLHLVSATSVARKEWKLSAPNSQNRRSRLR
jgi:hypothetical protein